ncbi:MAG TPA: exopolysaccharide Pel transporter PelG [Erysipelotrichaceae bacterium]|nr:exopolysaccharide Pel transporter PelG [Erysipelotrichaceae bacterium]
MAGIGFELRKIFRKTTISSRIKGIVFATMTTIGPTIIFLIMLLSINLILDALNVSETQQIFFSSATLYLFLFSIIISGTTGTTITRFISDRIHENEEDYIPSAMFGTSIFVSILASIFASIIIVLLYLDGITDLLMLASLYILTIVVSITYNLMFFISALKEYLKITIAFFVGILLGALTFFVLYQFTNFNVLIIILMAMIVVFTIINLLLIYLILTFFNHSNHEYFAFLSYYKKHPYLFLSGLFYIVTLYVPNILYWLFSDIAIQVSIFRVAPSYDMALFLAILVNLSTPVLFVVKVETKFFEKYQKYVGSLINGTYSVIEKYRKIMLKTMDIELFYIYEVQLIITIILTCAGILLLPMLGFGGMVMNYFLLLSIGVYCTYLMYFTVIFLYYFDDQFGSFITTFTFFITTLLASIVALQLGVSYYPVALFVGGIVSWIVGFFRLRKFMETINARLYCKSAE